MLKDKVEKTRHFTDLIGYQFYEKSTHFDEF
jgi:ribosomal protein S21